MVTVINNAAILRAELQKRKAAGATIGLVPTMGALHEGHLSLVDVARKKADVVVVSIFVNPTQFGPNEDLAAYPRVENEDVAKLAEKQVDIAYCPTVEAMYPNGQQVDVFADTELAKGQCGAHRARHFDGVVTIVSRLLAQTEAEFAVFGEKDYQQLQVIRKMVRERAINCEIIGAPILREPDGLAMSSRNRYLSEKERTIAPKLQQVLLTVREELLAISAQSSQSEHIKNTLTKAKKRLLEAGFASVDYLDLVDVQTLQPITQISQPARLLTAATIGKTRLLDNIAVELS